MKKLKSFVSILLALIMIICSASCASTEKVKTDERIVVRLAAPQNGNIQDFETNWYKLWLEEQTGLKLEMTWLPLEDAEQIVRQSLNSGEGLPDAYIGFGSCFGSSLNSDFVFSHFNLIRYGEQGVILSLDELIEEHGVYTKKLFNEYPEMRLKTGITSGNGHIYFMPGYSTSIIKRYRPLMYINKGWLDALGMDVPTTTDELYKALYAFANDDPNGNGIADEIPFCGTEAFYSKQVYDYIINAFIYNDPINSRLYPVNGKLVFAPVQPEWREALKYMRSLYDDGLFSELNFTQDDQQMKQMANDERDILGAFTASNISYTVYQNSQGQTSRWVGMGPLTGPDGTCFSTVNTPFPKANAVITSACKYPDKVFKLFDLMMSEEAGIYSRFGEPGVDWEYAEGGVSIYGTPATIKILSDILNTPQNKHLQQMNPHVTPTKYNTGITWNGGIQSADYITAQTAIKYQWNDPPEYIETLPYTPEEEASIAEYRAAIEKHVKDTIKEFITGERDVYDDAVWNKYIREFDVLGLSEFVDVTQIAYDRTR